MTNARLTYSHRGPGLDHGWFSHQPTHLRTPLHWPGQKPTALWITVPIELFPLDAGAQPVRPLGALPLGYPDLWNYSNRDYGLRIGVYRIMQALDRFALRGSAAVNATIAVQYPRIIDELKRRNWEFIANGVHMGQPHHGGRSNDDERALVQDAKRMLLEATGAAPIGWHSPGRSQSQNTMTLLAEQGFRYVTDWANDDMPYAVTTKAGPLCALPLAYAWSDRLLLVQHNLTADEYVDQVLQAFSHLASEADQRGGGRILSLSVTPWILGYPHRIAALERLLGRLVETKAVWNATGSEIADVFDQQSQRAT